MKKSIYLICSIILFSCTKNVTSTGTTSNQDATIILCNSNPVPYNGSLNGYSKWDIWNYNPLTFVNGIVGDSTMKILTLSANSYRIKNYGISSTNPTDTVIKFYDTVLSFGANKIYSIFTTLGRQYTIPPYYSTPNAANVIEEKDTVSPANGYAKVRLLICAPQISQGATSMPNSGMVAKFIIYNTKGDTINYNKRYYLDHQIDITLLQFKTIPSGSYTQFSDFPGYDRFAFNLESKKIYTIIINQMIRNRTPYEMDNPTLIKHSF